MIVFCYVDWSYSVGWGDNSGLMGMCLHSRTITHDLGVPVVMNWPLSLDMTLGPMSTAWEAFKSNLCVCWTGSLGTSAQARVPSTVGYPEHHQKWSLFLNSMLCSFSLWYRFSQYLCRSCDQWHPDIPHWCPVLGLLSYPSIHVSISNFRYLMSQNLGASADYCHGSPAAQDPICFMCKTELFSLEFTWAKTN